MGTLDRVGLSGLVPAAVAVSMVATLTAGCAGGHPAVQPSPSVSTLPPSPRPTVTIVRSGVVIAAGRGATVHAQAGVALTVTASRPSVSRTRLSRSYGYPPAYGYYVTFQLTIVNRGTEPVAIGPSSFFVRVTGQGKVTVTTGNAPYSGASSQLDSTQIDPGQTLRGPLTFDVRRVHGTLAYAPDGTAAVTWLF